jgi:hypothetical protein
MTAMPAGLIWSFQRQPDRAPLALGPVDGLKELDDLPAIGAGHKRRAILDDRTEEILDLEGVVPARRVERGEVRQSPGR